MWPFRSRPSVQPASDPVGAICRLLVDRWWEWAPGQTEDGGAQLAHTSGVCLSWEMRLDPRPYKYGRAPLVSISMANENGILTEMPFGDSARIYAAIQAHAAARIAHTPYRFTDAAVSLADAVKAGAHDAALALCDEILYHHNKPDST